MFRLYAGHPCSLILLWSSKSPSHACQTANKRSSICDSEQLRRIRIHSCMSTKFALNERSVHSSFKSGESEDCGRFSATMCVFFGRRCPRIWTRLY
ncbi:hypothetical protein EV361DRAFT_887754, partial [Lentinula raphanica]